MNQCLEVRRGHKETILTVPNKFWNRSNSTSDYGPLKTKRKRSNTALSAIGIWENDSPRLTK